MAVCQDKLALTPSGEKSAWGIAMIRHIKLLEYAQDYSTQKIQDVQDVALEQTDKYKAIKVERATEMTYICPEPMIGAYAERMAQEFAQQDGVLLRDFIEKLIFQEQWRRQKEAKELR